MRAGSATAYARNVDRDEDGDVEAQDVPHVVGPSRWQGALRRFVTLALVISGAWCINTLLLGEPWPRAATVCGDLAWLAMWSLWEHRRVSHNVMPALAALRRRRPAALVPSMSTTCHLT
ncbi:hypothetical protein pmac_cds_788 [Pandoravirus macleodensis]|uniref:Uncharacterized protein n=1 Tax=Pandoravirus macleodensis TaxID=2107707 RepID=A0A2U7UG82_9VIRU|nr:hypothetical protein pmac_cds_788 [Pandoravirus macleodensis]AVK77476.1 hypothetical protein pmac_cds_788 [Pandoravirus macleodensis]UMO80279.1 hypothetical protein [Pandoravirus aubagnensis]